MHDAVAAVHDNLGAGAPHVIFTTGWIGVVRAGSRRRRMCFGLGGREDYRSVVVIVLVVVPVEPPRDMPEAPACAAAGFWKPDRQLVCL